MPLREGVKANPADRFQFESYWLNHWDAHHLRLEIDEAAAWAHENNVPLICDEFGVNRDNSDNADVVGGVLVTDPASRFGWIHDVRTAFEADGIGWATWEYRGGWAVTTKEDGQAAQPDPAMMEALGLHGIK